MLKIYKKVKRKKKRRKSKEKMKERVEEIWELQRTRRRCNGGTKARLTWTMYDTKHKCIVPLCLTTIWSTFQTLRKSSTGRPHCQVAPHRGDRWQMAGVSIGWDGRRAWTQVNWIVPYLEPTSTFIDPWTPSHTQDCHTFSISYVFTLHKTYKLDFKKTLKNRKK